MRLLVMPLAAVALAACVPQVHVHTLAVPFPSSPLCDGQFQVANLAGGTVQHVLAQHPGGGRERDAIGRAVLPPGTEAPAALPPGPWRVRAVLADGRQFVLDGFDPCRAAVLRVTEAGLRPQ